MAAAVTRYQKKALSQRVQCVAAHLQRVELYKAWLRAGSPWRCRCATPACCWHSPRCAGSRQGWFLETGGKCGTATGRSLRRGIPDRSVGISEQSCAQSSRPSPGTCQRLSMDGTALGSEGGSPGGATVRRRPCHGEQCLPGLAPWPVIPCCSQGELRLLAQGAGSRLGSILAGSAKCCTGTGTVLDSAPGGC